jgi:hypothetical protein
LLRLHAITGPERRTAGRRLKPLTVIDKNSTLDIREMRSLCG